MHTTSRASALHPIGALALLGALALGACSLPFASPRASASRAPLASPASPSVGIGASPVPASPAASPAGTAAAGPFVPALQVPGTARVVVDGLAVRTSPDTQASQVDGVDARGTVATPNLFIGTGALVHVLSGPLEHQAIGWYRVAPVAGTSELSWESGNLARPQQGWIAGGRDRTPYLEPADAPDPPAAAATPRATPVPEIALVEAGRGPWISPRVELAGPPVVEWDAADPGDEGCRFGLFVSGAGGTQQAVSGSIARTDGSTWTDRGLAAGSYTLRIDGDCAWAIVVGGAPGG